MTKWYELSFKNYQNKLKNDRELYFSNGWSNGESRKKWLSLCEAGLRYFRPFNTTSCMYHCYCDHTGERSDDFQNKIANVNEPEVQTNASWISDNSCYKMSNLWSICDDRKRKPYTVGVPKDWISFLDENHAFPGGNSRGEIARNV